MQNIPLSVTPLAPRARRSTSVAENLRNLVDTGTLKPGDKLPTETMLCAQFGVSRTTLREAIQMLRTSGLLDVCPGRGSFVRLPDVSQLVRDLVLACNHSDETSTTIGKKHITQLRLMLQRDALAQLAHIPPPQRQQLFNFVVTRNASPEENALAEEQWHLTMMKLTGNPLNAHLLSALLAIEQKGRTARYHDADEVMRTIQTQLRINTAINEGEWDVAQRALTQFITMSGEPQRHSPVTAFPLPDAANGKTATNY